MTSTADSATRIDGTDPVDAATRRDATSPRADRPAPAGSLTPADADVLLEPHSIPGMVGRIRDLAVERAAHPVSYALRSFVGGAMVGFGVVLSLMASTGIAAPGPASAVMGLCFGFSFVLILVSGAALITADMAAGFVGVLARRLTVVGYLRMLAVGLVGNVLGVVVFVGVAAAAGGPYLGGPFLERATQVAGAKAGMGAAAMILLAVLCTWLLQTSMFMFFKARTDVARMGFAFYGPFAFVLGGTQHVIANVGFLGLPLLLAAFHGGPAAAAAAAADLSWGFGTGGLLGNLALTTIGNLIGGTLFVAVPFVLIARAMTREGAAAAPVD